MRKRRATGRSLVCKRVFSGQQRQQIRRAASAQIPATVDRLRAVVKVARERRQRHLCIVSGVPGSGKTLVGLQLVHTQIGANPAERGLYLSRNVPLVKVLQHYLKNTVVGRTDGNGPTGVTHGHQRDTVLGAHHTVRPLSKCT
jgi:Uncharacterized conserved protein (DUF2075)